MKRHSSLLSFVCLVWLLVHSHMVIADPVPEYEMKAAYLFNFAAFTTWPSDIQSTKSVRLCVMGQDGFGDSLKRLTKNTANGMRIKLSYLADLQEMSNCQILFINSSEVKNSSEILTQLDTSPVLTVTDNVALFRAGTMIGLFIDNNRLVFDVNFTRAKLSGLNLSSKLLHIAREVK